VPPGQRSTTRERPINPPPPWQVRAEFLCSLLVALCVIVPEVEERLKSVLPGRGRQQGAEAVEGSARVFALSDALPDSEKRELAWLSFAMLKNVNCCGVVVLREGGGGGGGGSTAVVARGSIGSGVAAAASGAGGSGSAATLDAISKVRGMGGLVCCRPGCTAAAISPIAKPLLDPSHRPPIHTHPHPSTHL